MQLNDAAIIPHFFIAPFQMLSAGQFLNSP